MPTSELFTPDHPARRHRAQPGLGGADVPVLLRRRPARRLAPGAPRLLRPRRRRPGHDRGRGRGARGPHHPRRTPASGTTPSATPGAASSTSCTAREPTAAVQLAHGCPAQGLRGQPLGRGPVAPTPRAAGSRRSVGGGLSRACANPRALTVAEIEQVVEAFGARRGARRRGLLRRRRGHAAHGYLLHEFLSPALQTTRTTSTAAPSSTAPGSCSTSCAGSARPSARTCRCRCASPRPDWAEGGWDADSVGACPSRGCCARPASTAGRHLPGGNLRVRHPGGAGLPGAVSGRIRAEARHRLGCGGPGSRVQAGQRVIAPRPGRRGVCWPASLWLPRPRTGGRCAAAHELGVESGVGVRLAAVQVTARVGGRLVRPSARVRSSER